MDELGVGHQLGGEGAVDGWVGDKAVGTKTVSRVINNEPYVSDEIRDRVHRAITILDYQPDLGASSLKRSGHRTNAIGVLIDHLDTNYAAAFLNGVEAQTTPRGTAILLASSHNDPDLEQTQVNRFTRRRVDGIILARCTASIEQALRTDAVGDLPIVLVDTHTDRLRVDTVSSDHYHAATLATRHLLDRGHRRIAHLSPEFTSVSARDGHRGYNDTMMDAGLPTWHRELSMRDSSAAEPEITTSIRLLLTRAEPPTALLTSTTALTTGVVHALQDADQQQQIALIALDELAGADLLRPAITTIRHDHGELGRLAAERLCIHLASRLSDVAALTVPAGLVLRGSGEILPSR